MARALNSNLPSCNPLDLNGQLVNEEIQSRHDFRNVSQTLVLIEDARKRGIERLYNHGMARLDDLEVQVRAYRPSADEQDEHASLITLIESLRTSHLIKR